MNLKNKTSTLTILAIETSCDETAAAVLSVDLYHPSVPSYIMRGIFPKIKTLSSVVKSQIKLHSKMGGVVPEAAARAHVKWIRSVVQRALDDAKVSLSNNQRFDLTLPSPRQERRERGAVDYIAVTVGPGLLPSLMIGVEFAKALSFATGIPIIPVNHMAGHIYSPFGREFQISNFKFQNIFPQISLIVSGGHTILVLMESDKKYKVLGQTLDDAAGEAFDKVAKMLSLPYPGGPEVSRLAIKGNPKAINFPRPMIYQKNYNFSFSGLKTSVFYYLRDNPLTPKTQNLIPDVCASFQQAVIDVLVAKTLRAVKQFNAKSISLSGGVAANKKLRDELQVTSYKLQVKFFSPAKNLCTDNAEMIGIASVFMLQNGFKPVSYKKVKADSNLHL